MPNSVHHRAVTACPVRPRRRTIDIVPILTTRHSSAQWSDVVAAGPVGRAKDEHQPAVRQRAELHSSGVVNDPAVERQRGPTPPSEAATRSTSTTPFTTTGSTRNATPDPLQARQLEARYLYVLACLTANTTRFGSSDYTAGERDIRGRGEVPSAMGGQRSGFRDRDSIMTPFNYDPKIRQIPTRASPSDWVDPTDEMHTVWGCKRPELLISETLAFHDRRTEDTDQRTGRPGDDHKPGTVSQHRYTQEEGQHFRPALQAPGSLFIKLFNPWTPQ